jgi:hypothetical protein
MVPRVAIIEGIFNFTTIIPFNKPIKVPIRMEIIIENQSGIPNGTKYADSIPVNPIILPIERSKFPEIIRSVTAQPEIITNETCRLTLFKLVMVRNLFDKTDRIIPIKMSIPTITNF